MLKDFELARAVAALDDEDAGRLDEAVLELRHRRRTEAEVACMAALRAMTDFEAFEASITSWVSLTGDVHPVDKALQVLRDAGFVRGSGLKALYQAGWNDAIRRYPDDGEAEFQQGKDRAIERVLLMERI